MKKYLLLFRGINVGGNNLLPMKAFVSLLAKAGYQNVSSYIQSGNIVLESDYLPLKSIQSLVLEHYQFSPNIFIMQQQEFDTAYQNNPYREYEGKFVHIYFCQENIVLNTDKINQYKTPSEEFTVEGNIFYLHAPDGIGRSKLVTNIERCLGQSATGRNLNTVNKIYAMLKGS